MMTYDPIAKKLNEQKVREIRMLLRWRTITQREIAKQYGVSEVIISNIKRNKIWVGV
jgi:hypothetical protein